MTGHFYPAPDQMQSARSGVEPGVYRRSPEHYQKGVNYLDSEEQVVEMVAFIRQRPISYIGYHVEPKMHPSCAAASEEKQVWDPKAVRPLLCSFAVVERPVQKDKQVTYFFVVDAREAGTFKALALLLCRQVPFVSFDGACSLYCFWNAGLLEPGEVWDVQIFERMMTLGIFHHRYYLPGDADELGEIDCKNDCRELKRIHESLGKICQRNGIDFPWSPMDSNRVSEFIAAHDSDCPFSTEHRAFAADIADAVAKLYPLQIQRAVDQGLLRHLLNIEMPWVVTTAGMTWVGIRIDAQRRDAALAEIQNTGRPLQQTCKSYGLNNVLSSDEMKAFFAKHGLLQHFEKNGKHVFDRDTLEKHVRRHPAIRTIMNLRHLRDLAAEKVMTDEYVGSDGRIHPQYIQLGSETGRQTSRFPNVMGLDKRLRFLVVPDPGYGIGEADWCQIETGIAGAIYGDERLIEMYNTGDVYSAMAQLYYKDKISAADGALSGEEFKHKHPDKRKEMKQCTLAMLYGITPKGLSVLLQIHPIQAAAVQRQFLEMFPQLVRGLKRETMEAGYRGFAQAINSVRRYRARQDSPSTWEKNWFTNHPVQGTAAVIFKSAGNRLHKLFKAYEGRLIIPIHDSFVFEVPMGLIQEVAVLTSSVMIQSVQEVFPELKPKVEVNMANPSCWNKEGNAGLFYDWLTEVQNEEGITRS